MKFLENISILLEEKDSVLIAVSGGADSMALLDFTRRRASGHKIAVAHLNHGLREESDADQRLVEDYCNKHGIDFYSKKVDLTGSSYQGMTLEEAGREARYQFFRDLIHTHNFTVLLTAHHLNDQAETILMRLMRGTGPRGMSGIPEESDFYGARLLRPFLSISKDALLQYCQDQSIPYSEDITNSNTEFTRNLIRNTIIPQLENYSPDFSNKLSKFAKLQEREQHFLSQIRERILQRCITSTDDGILLDSELFTNPEHLLTSLGLEFLDQKSIHYLQTEAIRSAIDTLDGLKDLGSYHVEKVREHFSYNNGGYIDLPNDIRAYKNSGICEIINFKATHRNFQSRCRMILNSKTSAYYLTRDKMILTIERGKASDFEGYPTENSALIKINSNCRDFIFRKREPGDRVYLKGMTSGKKLSRFLIDRKVPQRYRDTIPVLADGNTIIWIPGLYIHRDYNVISADDEVVALKIKRYQ